jgi:hypothetical protein
MKCAKCKKEKEKGAYYTFHYGRSVGSSQRVKSDSPLAKKYKQTYQIAGSKQAWICTACLIQGIMRSPAGIAATLAVVSALVLVFRDSLWYVLGEDPALYGGLGLILCALYLVNYAFDYNVDAIAVCGDDQAIRAYRSELKAAGHDMFFNRREYRKLS